MCWNWLFWRKKEEEKRKKKILLGTLMPISLIVIALSIFLGCFFSCKQNNESGHFVISTDNSVEITGHKGARDAIKYVKENYEIPSFLQIPKSGWYDPNHIPDSNVDQLTYTGFIGCLMGLDSVCQIPYDNEHHVKSDLFALFLYQHILEGNYSNYMMWIRSIYGCAWRILNVDSTFANIDWKNGDISNESTTFTSTPIISSDTYDRRDNTYKKINVEVERSPILSAVSNSNGNETIPFVFESNLQATIGLVTHRTKNKHGVVNTLVNLGRYANDVLYLHEDCKFWIGSSTIQGMSFSLANLAMSVHEKPANFCFLDIYMIDITKRLCHNEKYYPPTYL